MCEVSSRVVRERSLLLASSGMGYVDNTDAGANTYVGLCAVCAHVDLVWQAGGSVVRC